MKHLFLISSLALLFTLTAAIAGAQADAGANQAKGNELPTSSEAYVAAKNAKARQAFADNTSK